MSIEYVFYSINYSTQLDRDDSLNHNINITADPSPMEVYLGLVESGNGPCRGDTLKQVPKFPSSEVSKFRELQVPNFQVPGTSSSEIKVIKKMFFPISTKNILDTAFCLSTHNRLPSCAYE